MIHPPKRINLADAIGGKIANERPLAVGDKVTERYGKEEYRDVHCIYGQVNTRTIYVRNEQSSLLWGHTVEARNRESLTEDEAQRLLCLCADNKELLKSWHRINPDGTKTSLGDIYAERVEVEVGEGSWLRPCRCAMLYVLAYKSVNRMSLIRMYSRGSYRCLVVREVDIVSLHDMTADELYKLLESELHNFDLLPPADALAMLGEMEESK